VSRKVAPAIGSTGEQSQSPAEPEKVSQPQVKLSDIITVLPEQAAWITPRPVLWRDASFKVWNGAMAGMVVLLLGFKLGAWLWHSRAASPTAPVRRLWKELHRSGLSRGAFYQAAAQYVRRRGGSTGPEVQAVLAQHDQINFSPSLEAASVPVPPDERARVLRILQS
jgi:hypothetical protein